VLHQLKHCNGATIPHLCTLTWRAEGPLRPPTAASRESAGRSAGQRYRALCIFHERFLQGAALKSRTASHVQSSDLVKTEVLNCTRLALNFSADLTKDAVFAGSRELVGAIFALASEHGDVAIEFGQIGMIVVKDRHASFEFSPEFVPAPEREGALMRLAEIRRLATPSNDPMLNRYANVPTGSELLLVNSGLQPANAASASALPPHASLGPRAPRPPRTPLRRGSTPMPPRQPPLNSGLPRNLSGGDLLIRPSTGLPPRLAPGLAPGLTSSFKGPPELATRSSDPAPSPAPRNPPPSPAPRIPPQFIPRRESAGMNFLGSRGGEGGAGRRSDGRQRPTQVDGARVRASLGGRQPTAPGRGQATPRARAGPGKERSSKGGVMPARLRAASQGTLKELLLKKGSSLSLDLLRLDADELELENLCLSPVPRLLPGEGAKHTPPSSPTFTTVQRDLSAAQQQQPLCREDASAVLKQNRCLSPGGASRMLEWLTQSGQYSR